MKALGGLGGLSESSAGLSACGGADARTSRGPERLPLTHRLASPPDQHLPDKPQRNLLDLSP